MQDTERHSLNVNDSCKYSYFPNRFTRGNRGSHANVRRKLTDQKPTCTIKPITKTIATQETMSAWFCMTNSWLSIGGFLLELLRPFTATILSQTSVCSLHGERGTTEQTSVASPRKPGHATPRRFTVETSRARRPTRWAMWRSLL